MAFQGVMGSLVRLLVSILFFSSTLLSATPKTVKSEDTEESACALLIHELKDNNNINAVWKLCDHWPAVRSSAVLAISKSHSLLALRIVEHYRFYLRFRLLMMAAHDPELVNSDVLYQIFLNYLLTWCPADDFGNCLFYMGYRKPQ